MMLRYGFRSLARQKLRTGITLAAIAFGVASLIVSGGFVADLLTKLGEASIHSRTGHLQLAARGYFESSGQSPEKFRLANPTRIESAIRSEPGVADVLARLTFSGLMSNGRSDRPVAGEGVDPSREVHLGSYLQVIAGRTLRDDDKYEVMVGEGVAAALDLHPSDRVTILARTDAGALDSIDLDVCGVFRTYSREYDARAIRVPLPVARELLGTTATSVLVVSLSHTRDTASVASALRGRLARGSIQVKTWVELNDFYQKTVDLYRQQFGVLQAIMLALVLLSVANSVNMSMFERVGEFGTMMALGNRSRHVFQTIVTEAALMGAIGGAAGGVLGLAAAFAISAVGIPMPPPPNANLAYNAAIQVVPDVIAQAVLVGFAAAVFAGLLAGARISRTPITVALRENL